MSALDRRGAAIDRNSRDYGITVKQANKTRKNKTKNLFYFILLETGIK
jgi:hypothetical protein